MVVTRKTPLVPPAPGSKSSASQATPRVAKVKGQAVSSGASKDGMGAGLSSGVESPGTTGDEAELSLNHKSKHKSKKDKKKSRKSGKTFWDFLMHALFITFAVYTATVCPADKGHETAVCRGLNKYRELILEPILFPAFHRIIEHPSVAPYVAQVQPHIDTAVRFSTPIIYRTQSEWNGRVVPQWNKRVVPQWKKRVVPQWNQHVVPQWEKHVIPQIMAIDAKIEPYRSFATQEYTRYFNTIAPHVTVATQRLQDWQQQAQPYVILAATKTHEGYQTAKPYAIPLWNRFKAALKELLIFLREQRILFVDPHVARIWEKVVELSSGKPADARVTIFEGAAAPSAAAPLTPAENVAADTIAATATSFSSSEETPTTMSFTTPSSTVASSALPTESLATLSTEPPAALFTKPLVSPVDPSTLVLESSSVPDVASESILPSPSKIAPVVPESTVSQEPSSASTTSTASAIYATTGPSVIMTYPAPTPSAVDFDIDEFTRALGLDEEDVPEEEAVIVEQPEESEEEKAEKLRLKAQKTAQDRANIEQRHVKWEQDLDSLIKGNMQKLKKKLNTIRKPKAEELKNSKAVKAAMQTIVSEADKYLKGGEVYLQTIKAESKKESVKLTLWSRVMDKINTKFQDRLGEVDVVVNEWYMDVLNEEVQELTSLTKEVSDMSGEAQADLGMDYSWLGDVTYNDWQRYHDLAQVSEDFTKNATDLQRGIGPSPMHNPITAILEDLEEELQDTVGGFETRLRNLRRDGERVLAGKVEAPQPTASTWDDENQGSIAADVPPVIIGRTQDEVLEALNRADSAGASSHTVHEEPADAVETLAQEASAEGEASTVSIPAHAEL